MAYTDEKLPESIDLSHHLSALSKARPMSPLKDLQKYWGKPGLISLAGGLPSPEVFPFDSVGADILLPDSFPTRSETLKGSPLSWLWSLFSSGKAKTAPIEIPRYASAPGGMDLATILQYSLASGHPKLKEFAKTMADRVYKPAYSDYTVLAHVGNTDGWVKAVMTLCNPGEGVLASAWTYPSALAAMRPYNIQPVSVAMDGQGMRADALRELLANWDAEERRMPRPHVMYTVPVGQNPTGATMEASRKKEIYDICVEYDVIIVEDDPYYFLQEGPYRPNAHRAREQTKDTSLEKYIEALAPSYLRFDYQGRVIRLDTFSKTVAPGCRMGWFTCNPKFAERLERQAETSSQAPCGFSQGLVIRMIEQWGFDGFLRWTQGLANQYTIRRDFIIDRFAEEFDLSIDVPAEKSTADYFVGCSVYTAYSKQRRAAFTEKLGADRVALVSFVPPTAGMFVWVKLHLDRHPKHGSIPTKELEKLLWIELAEAGVLFGPGQMFAAEYDENADGHFRISFSNAEFEDLKKAIAIFAMVIVKFFRN